MKQLRWLIPLLVFVSCQNRSDGILSTRKMEKVIYDLSVTDGVLWITHQQYGHEEVCEAIYQQVLDEHGITRAQFDSSLVYYNAHPNIVDKIYLHVEERLQQAYKEARVMAQLQADYENAQRNMRRYWWSMQPYSGQVHQVTPQSYYEALSKQPTLLPDPATFQHRN